MVVKTKGHPIEKIRNIIKERNGLLLTSDLEKPGIPRTYLDILLRQGEIQRVSRGVYVAAGQMVDEMAGIQARFKAAIFSHATALFLLGLTDRTPLFYSITVPSGYNASHLKRAAAKVFFVRRDLFRVGEITVKSPHGNDIKTFDLERTVCDVLRSRNQMDEQLVNEALKKYALRRDGNITRLYEYAGQFGIQKMVRGYLEVLL